MNRKKSLVALLGVLALGGLVSLPWQLQQWRALGAEREKTTLQETRLQELARLRQQTDRARTQSTNDPASRMEAAQLLVRSGDSRNARPLLRQLEEDSQRVPGMRSAVGDLYRQIGQVDRAYALLTGALSASPNDTATLVRLGYLELSLGERSTGLERFRKAQKADPKAQEPLLAEAFYQDQERNYPLGEQLLRRALALDPTRWPTELLLADCLAKQRRYDQALPLLESLQKQHPNETSILAQRARTLLEVADRTPTQAQALQKQAVALLQSAFQLAPGDASLVFDLGRAFKALGQETQALSAWEESLRLKPSYPRLKGQLGQLLIRLGKSERGKQLLREDEAAENARVAFSVEVGKARQSWKDIGARRRFAAWCESHQQESRAILEWERLLREFPGDAEATRALERLRKPAVD